MTRLAMLLLMVFIAVPIAVIGTFLLMPLWRWIERVWALEAIGHSGPATWCFVATYGVALATMLLVRRHVRRGSR